VIEDERAFGIDRLPERIGEARDIFLCRSFEQPILLQIPNFVFHRASGAHSRSWRRSTPKRSIHPLSLLRGSKV